VLSPWVLQDAGRSGIEPVHYHRCSKAHGRVIASTLHPFTYELDANTSVISQENGDLKSKGPLASISRGALPYANLVRLSLRVDGFLIAMAGSSLAIVTTSPFRWEFPETWRKCGQT
jgi:hypothetical protein